MSAQHTIGPWAVHPISARVDAFAGGMPLPVCKLLWPTDKRSEAETEANAHLIAAAPEMLEALRAITEHTGCCDPDCCEAAIAHEHARTLCRAAIAKAEAR